MAVKPIIIPLVADTAGLTVGIEALEQLGTIDAKTAADFKAASKAFADRGKVLGETVVATDKLVVASKNLTESIVGGGIGKAVDDIKKYSDAVKNIPKVLVPGGAKAELSSLKNQFAAGTLQVDALATSISLAKKKLQELAPESKAFNQLEAELKASIVANELLNKSFTSTRGELKAMREALIQLEDGGLEGTKVFENLAISAGQLDDQVGDTQARIKALGSDTFALDAGIQAVQGLAGAFSVAQGAAALLGSEDEDLQKTLLKVNAAIAVLNGLQQIQQILQKESVVSLAANIALERIDVIQKNLQGAAESRNIIVRYAAIAAQKALNAVMALTPTGIILLALGALAGALLTYSQNTKTAAETQEELNAQLEKTNKLLDDQIGANEAVRNTRKGNLNDQQQELSLLQARGVLQSKLLAQERKVLETELQNEKVRRESLSGAKGRETEFDDASKNILSIQLKLSDNQLKAQKTFQDESLKSASSFAESKVAQAEKGSDAELKAQIASIRTREKEDLSSESLTQGERVKIVTQAERQIKELRENFLREQLNNQSSILQTQAALEIDAVKKQELLKSSVILKAQSDAIGKTADQQKLIELQKQEQIKQIDDEATRAILENRLSLYKAASVLEKDDAIKAALEKESAIVQAQIDSIGKSKEQALVVERQKQQQITDIDLEEERKRLEQRLSEIQLQGAIETDEFKKLEIQKQEVLLQEQINALGKSKAERLKNETDTQAQLTAIQRQAEAERRSLIASGLDAAISLSQAVTAVAKNQADAEMAIIQNKFDQGLISQKEYDKQVKIIKQREAVREKQAALFEAFIATASAVVKALPNIPLSVLAAVLGAAQIAVIASKPIPQFKKGTRDAPGGPSLVGEAGPELIYSKGNWQYASKATVLDLPEHAKVIPTLDTQKILSRYDIPMPSVQQHVNTSIGGVNIDYRKLGMAVGKEISKLPLQQNNWDENGYSSYQTSIAGRKSYLNTKFRSPRK
jgi:hypothetical protein